MKDKKKDVNIILDLETHISHTHAHTQHTFDDAQSKHAVTYSTTLFNLRVDKTSLKR